MTSDSILISNYIKYIKNNINFLILQFLLNYYQGKKPLSQSELIKILKYKNDELNDTLEIVKSLPYDSATRLLCIACEEGNEHIVKYLIENGVDKGDKYQYLSNFDPKEMPLFIAINNGHESFFKCLVEHGVDINKVYCDDYDRKYINDSDEEYYDYNFSPLVIAVNNDNESMVKCLINLGAQLNDNYLGYSQISNSGFKKVPLIVACNRGNESMVKCLVEYGANVNEVYGIDECGRELFCCMSYTTPLMSAIKKGNEAIVKYLIEHGADVNASVKRQKNFYRHFDEIYPLSLATGNLTIIQYLVEHGAKEKKKVNKVINGFNCNDKITKETLSSVDSDIKLF